MPIIGALSEANTGSGAYNIDLFKNNDTGTKPDTDMIVTESKSQPKEESESGSNASSGSSNSHSGSASSEDDDDEEDSEMVEEKKQDAIEVP